MNRLNSVKNAEISIHPKFDEIEAMRSMPVRRCDVSGGAIG